jgi:uncharacterized protein YkwD
MTARYSITATVAVAVLCIVSTGAPAIGHADNSRLNDSVVANAYAARYDAGCRSDIRIDPRLRLAAQWHTENLLADRNLEGHVGSDGSLPQDRANAAGFQGTVAETVAINPALAISGLEVLRQWHSDPDAFAILSDCANTAIGVWSANGLDRTVLVAVYGSPT